MRYRINLHVPPSRRRARTVRIVLFALVLLEIIAAAVFQVSGTLLRERTGGLAARVEAMEALILPPPPADPVLSGLIEARLHRLDWAPVLAALADRAPDGIVITEIRGVSPDHASEASGVVLKGYVAAGGAGIDPVSALLDSLAGTPALRRVFPRVSLERMGGSSVPVFTVSCRAGTTGE